MMILRRALVFRQSFGTGFFFEIIERRGVYQGYGAMNAAFRIAAQRRLAKPDLAIMI